MVQVLTPECELIMSEQIEFDKDYLEAFCRRHRIKRLSLFGSALRGELGPDSDIDLLVEFEPDARPSLFDVGGMMHELTEVMGRVPPFAENWGPTATSICLSSLSRMLGRRCSTSVG